MNANVTVAMNPTVAACCFHLDCCVTAAFPHPASRCAADLSPRERRDRAIRSRITFHASGLAIHNSQFTIYFFLTFFHSRIPWSMIGANMLASRIANMVPAGHAEKTDITTVTAPMNAP